MATKSSSWCFTLNNYTEDQVHYLQTLPLDSKKLQYIVFAKEVAPETGTKHLQGFLYCKGPMAMTAIKKFMRIDTVHLEAKSKNSTFEQAINYCKKITSEWIHERGVAPLDHKERSRKGGESKFDGLIKAVEAGVDRKTIDKTFPGIAAFCPQYISKLLNYQRLDMMPKPDWVLFDWQQTIKHTIMYSEPQDRKIYWIWSEESNTGKSTFFTQYMAYKLKEKLLTVDSLKFADIIHAYNDQSCVHLDIPRCPEEDTNKFLYVVLEKLSNRGAHFSGKYDSSMKILDAHICITANVAPQPFRLPERFIEVKITKDGSAKWFDWTTKNQEVPEELQIDQSTISKRQRDWEEEDQLRKLMKADEAIIKRGKQLADLEKLREQGHATFKKSNNYF